MGSTAASGTVIPLATRLPAEITHDDAMRLFEYDRSLTLDIREEGLTADGEAILHPFNYRDMSGKRARAILVLPEGTGPFGAVMFLPGGTSDRTEFLHDSVDLASHGIASLLIDYPELYDVPATDQEAVSEIIFEMRELRRLMDWLASQPEVDPDKLGMMGVSYGGCRGATFAGVEDGRLRITVLMSTPASYHLPYMAPFDPILWVPYVSPGELYIQEGTQDVWFTHDEAESLIAAAREPKRLVWYEAGHGLNAQADADYGTWLVAALGSS
jgi:dienelactone hydrolase